MRMSLIGTKAVGLRTLGGFCEGTKNSREEEQLF